MNKYKVIDNLPFGFDFHNRTRNELRKYSEWFLQNKELRINELIHAVERFFDRTWCHDYSVCSLNELNSFLLKNISSEPLSFEELKENYGNTPNYIDIETQELTIESRSLLVDTGIYWGDVFIRNHDSLHWEQYLRNKKLNDYGHMVIMLKNNPPINPIWLMYIQGLKIIRGKVSQHFLNDLYSIWENHI